MNKPTMITLPNSSKFWYLNGERHRVNGPAREESDGTKAWYLNGKRHREDGPAVIWPDGTKFWYLNGKFIKKEDPIKQQANWIKEGF